MSVTDQMNPRVLMCLPDTWNTLVPLDGSRRRLMNGPPWRIVAAFVSLSSRTRNVGLGLWRDSCHAGHRRLTWARSSGG